MDAKTRSKISEGLKRFYRTGQKAVDETVATIKTTAKKALDSTTLDEKAIALKDKVAKKATEAVKKKAEETLSKAEEKLYKSKGIQKERSEYANALLTVNVEADRRRQRLTRVKERLNQQSREPSEMTFGDKLKNKVNEGLYHTKRTASSLKDKVKQKLKKKSKFE